MQRIAACVWVLGTLVGSVLAEPVLEYAPAPDGAWTFDAEAQVVETAEGRYEATAAVTTRARFFRVADDTMAYCILSIQRADESVVLVFAAPTAETDGDGVPDCTDICQGYDDRMDSDGDGVPDGCDWERTLTLPGGVALELVRIPAGSFQMGSPATERSRDSDEGPVHTVTIGYDFYMGKYEVTQGQWLELMAGQLARGAPGLVYPVRGVSWNDAKSFIAALNAHIVATGQGPTVRLPSEAEWEYACRAGT